MPEPRTIPVPPEAAGQRLDHFIATQLDGVSRSRVQLLLDQGDVLVDGEQSKPSLKLRGGEQITILDHFQPPPLRAIAEDIPLDIVYEDNDLAVVNKPAGMMVHAGAGATDSERNRGTLVNALLFHFQTLSAVGGELRRDRVVETIARLQRLRFACQVNRLGHGRLHPDMFGWCEVLGGHEVRGQFVVVAEHRAVEPHRVVRDFLLTLRAIRLRDLARVAVTEDRLDAR